MSPLVINKMSPIYLMDNISKMYMYVYINKPIYKLTFMDGVLYSEEQNYYVGL